MSKRVQKKVTPAPVVVETPVEVIETPVVEETTEVPQVTFNDIIKSALDEIISLKTQVKSLEGTIRNVKVLYKEEMKANKSAKKRRRRENGEKQVVNHGFVKPCPISDALSSFLGLKSGAELARPEVTKLIAKYVNENELWGTKANKDGVEVLNKTIIKPDAKLKKLLGEPTILLSQKNPEGPKSYSYFNLHSYLKRGNHFLPQVKVETA
jgi:chromatin remodeling complex protein RSC6